MRVNSMEVVVDGAIAALINGVAEKQRQHHPEENLPGARHGEIMLCLAPLLRMLEGYESSDFRLHRNNAFKILLQEHVLASLPWLEPVAAKRLNHTHMLAQMVPFPL